MSNTLPRLSDLPLPPPEMRRLVGSEDTSIFDNPTRALVFPHLPTESYDAVFDFGCGCGRVARQLIQQIPQPRRYLGVDLHRGMIEWCRANLTPRAPSFQFDHHDVRHISLNPGDQKPMVLPFPAADESFTLVNAWSVFTHLTQSQAEHYLREVARILGRDGFFNATWFLFDKAEYPMLTELQNALYTNEHDLSASVIFDRQWVRRSAAEVGLTITQVLPPVMRNFHWIVVMAPSRAGVEEASFPADEAPIGSSPPPPMPADADRIGLDR